MDGVDYLVSLHLRVEFGTSGLIVASYCITIAASVALYAVLLGENKRRARMEVNEEERDRLAFWI